MDGRPASCHPQDRDGDPSATTVATIRNRRGLHARAAARFVKLADTFDAAITVTKGTQTVSGNSIMGLMMLAAGPGCAVEIAASGSDARSAVDALGSLIAAKFDEE